MLQSPRSNAQQLSDEMAVLDRLMPLGRVAPAGSRATRTLRRNSSIWAVWLAGGPVLVSAAVLSKFSTVLVAHAHLPRRPFGESFRAADDAPAAGRDASRNAVWARPAGLPVPGAGVLPSP